MRLPAFLVVAVIAALGQTAPLTAQPVAEKPSPFRLQLLPKSFSARPSLEMTVYSERTDYGRTLPEASPQHPVYYVAHNSGYRPLGSAPPGDRHLPDAGQMEKLLHDALAKSGFLPAEGSGQQPTLALFYHWGTHAGVDPKDALLMGGGLDLESLTILHHQDILERAALVGGRPYAKKLEWELSYGAGPGSFTARNEHLRYQAENDLYYVIVSAYDYASMARNERRLAWRTTLTVNDDGVAMKETFPPLLLSAVDYFGRDTGESVALERHIDRSSVTLGPLNIIGEATLKDSTPPKQ